MELLILAVEALVLVGLAIAVAHRRGWLLAGLGCAGAGLIAELVRALVEGRAATWRTVLDGIVWGLILGTGAGWLTVRKDRRASV
jgi:hypothetical protein